METKKIEEIMHDLENETYYLMKSIDALRIKVIPEEADLKNDYTGALLAILGNQSKLIHKMAQEINEYNKMAQKIDEYLTKGDLENDWN